jgi:NADPH:quinone reductase-like Zn-dependent oxidoreductase
MKAAVHTRYGPADVVRISDVEKPTARDNEVLVKVHATTVNRTDCGFRAAKPFVSAWPRFAVAYRAGGGDQGVWGLGWSSPSTQTSARSS